MQQNQIRRTAGLVQKASRGGPGSTLRQTGRRFVAIGEHIQSTLATGKSRPASPAVASVSGLPGNAADFAQTQLDAAESAGEKGAAGDVAQPQSQATGELQQQQGLEAAASLTPAVANAARMCGPGPIQSVSSRATIRMPG